MQCTTQLTLPVTPPDDSMELEYQEIAGLGATFLGFVNNKELSDVSFIVGNNATKIYAHKTILAMRSDYFKRMFTSSLKESLPNCTITKPNVHSKIFMKVLEYIYTGKLRITTEREAVKLMITAEEFHLPNIVEAAVHYLRQHINIQNACTLLELARQHYIASLEEICMSFLATHARKIFCPPDKDMEGLCSLSQEALIQLLKSDALAIEEIDVFRGVVQWSKKYSENNPDVTVQQAMEKIIPYIRFTVMTPAELLEVEQTNLVPEKELYTAFKHLLLPHCTKPNVVTSYRRGKLQFEESTLLSPEQQHTLASWYTHSSPVKEWMLCYRGSRDGFNSRVFHAECDERGETFTVLLVEPFDKQNSKQYLLGGYTSNSWTSWGRPQQDPHAFLFSFGPWNGTFHPIGKRGANPEPPTQWKMPIVPTFAHCATMGSSSYGPVFGGGRDIMVDLNHKECTFRPHSYGCPPPGAFPAPALGTTPSTTTCTNFSCALIDIEVFCKPRPRRASIA